MMRPIRTRIEFEEKNIIKGWERSGTNFQLKLLKDWKSLSLSSQTWSQNNFLTFEKILSHARKRTLIIITFQHHKKTLSSLFFGSFSSRTFLLLSKRKTLRCSRKKLEKGHFSSWTLNYHQSALFFCLSSKISRNTKFIKKFQSIFLMTVELKWKCFKLLILQNKIIVNNLCGWRLRDDGNERIKKASRKI